MPQMRRSPRAWPAPGCTITWGARGCAPSRDGLLRPATRAVRTYHRRARPDREVAPPLLDWGGQYQGRREGEFHLFNPETVFRLQHATRTGQYDIFKSYTRSVDEQSERLCTLRGMFAFRRDH